MQINNFDDIIDSRDIIQRIDELRVEWMDSANIDESDDLYPEDYALSEEDWAVHLGEHGAREMTTLLALAQEGENYEDWEYGATLIRDSYFTDYAREMAEDIGAIDRDAAWPLGFIDWDAAADALRQDYTSIDFDGETFWVR